MNAKSLVAGAAFAATWQIMGHYLPVSKPFERPNVPSRLGAYTYGTTGILLGLGIATDARTLGASFAIAAAAGAATIAVYVADSIASAPAKEMLRHGFKS